MAAANYWFIEADLGRPPFQSNYDRTIEANLRNNSGHFQPWIPPTADIGFPRSRLVQYIVARVLGHERVPDGKVAKPDLSHGARVLGWTHGGTAEQSKRQHTEGSHVL